MPRVTRFVVMAMPSGALELSANHPFVRLGRFHLGIGLDRVLWGGDLSRIN
jgi:hypothetical protein